MRNKLITSFCIFIACILFSSQYAWAQSASAQSGQDNLIVPGVRVDGIIIGKPIPSAVLKKLGKPTTYTAPLPGKEGLDTGNYFWDGIFNVKLNDGRGDKNVFQIFVISRKFSTQKGIKVGSSWKEVRKAYPGGKKIETMDVDFGWSLPGITFNIAENKVCGIGVRASSAK